MDETKELIENTQLRFVTDNRPGISRSASGDSFVYHDPDGKRITDDVTLERIKGLGIPPAWNKVWISTSPNGHLQATGRDAKKRKQYRYHKKWNEISQMNKFGNLLEFASALPTLRKKVQSDMSKSGMSREKVLATVVWLLENTLIRVGNEEYAKENKSYGLTTLKNQHVSVRGSDIKFQFKGKSGVQHAVKVRSKRVAKIIRHCKDLPGQELFEYIDDDKKRQVINSDDVNQYLKEATGMDISAKDFRTWGGTTLAASLLDKLGLKETEAEVKQSLVDITKEVASYLRNKPSTCRKYYIHPIVFEHYQKGDTISSIRDKIKKKLKLSKDLDADEVGVVALLSYKRPKSN